MDKAQHHADRTLDWDVAGGVGRRCVTTLVLNTKKPRQHTLATAEVRETTPNAQAPLSVVLFAGHALFLHLSRGREDVRMLVENCQEETAPPANAADACTLYEKEERERYGKAESRHEVKHSIRAWVQCRRGATSNLLHVKSVIAAR